MRKGGVSQHIVKQLDLDAFNRSGGIRWRGLDYISYGLMMQELERGRQRRTIDRIRTGQPRDVSDLSIWQ